MKILHVCRGMANLSGTTHIVRSISEHQSQQGHEVHVWFVSRPGQPAVMPGHGVTTREFPLSLPFMNPGVSRPFAQGINRAIPQFDVVHIHAIWNHPTLATIRAAVKNNVPCIVAPQGSLEPWALQYRAWKKSWYTRGIELPWIRRATCMQALTEAEEIQIRNAGITTRVARIPNGIDTDEFATLPDSTAFRREHDIPLDAPTVLFMGRIHPKKGLDQSARIMVHLLKSVPNAILIVAGGDGGHGYMETGRSFFAEAGVMDNVRFVGEMRGEQKRVALDAADAFLLASYSEGLPMAVLEALASGVPPVISTHCNIPEVAEHRAGSVLPLDPEAFAAALAALLGNSQHRAECARRARDLAREKFEWRSIADQAVQVYSTLRKASA